MIRPLLFLALLSGCTTAGPWSVDTIASGDPQFNSSRLVYHSRTHSPIAFELYKMGDQMKAFLTLARFRLSPGMTKLIITIEGKTFEENLPPHEGQMRVPLPTEIASLLIQALQEGKKVGILLDGFEETLDPHQFSLSFDRFIGSSGKNFFNNLFKGPSP